MDLSQRVGDPSPIVFGVRGLAFDIRQHAQTVDEEPAVGGGNERRYGQTVIVQVVNELGFPGQVVVTSCSEPADGWFA